MSNQEDVCWHEAGHAVLAGLHGLAARQSAILPSVTVEGNWTGFNRLIGHPGSMFIVSAAGVTGHLIRDHRDFSSVSQEALEVALSIARDDQQRHDAFVRGQSNAPTFIDTIKRQCWPALLANREKLDKMAEELMQRRSIGPLVHAAIMAGLPVEGIWREADDRYLALLPAPPAVPA